MFTIVEKRRWYYLFSSLIIIPGILIMLYSAATTGRLFRLSIDFEGGSIYELRFTEAGADESGLRAVFTEFGDDNPLIQQLGESSQNRWSVRTGYHNEAETRQIQERLEILAPLDRDALRVENVSALIGQEVTQAAFVAVLVAATIVTGFIILAFRQVPDAFRYGVCAILAMLHDVLIVSAVMSLMGLLFGWEVDALFLTAVLMIVGFSVQDTIVLFDRIRENIPKFLGEPYETIVNRSILETIHRSLTTQINVFFVIIAIMLFGGESIKQFVFILFAGLLTGSYSSIFIAVPLLVSWEKGEIPFVNRRHDLQTAEV
ncbi:MAG: protein translocase subunit SecF [Chloroflexi bacterium]|nr:protein translocase subunit SecF [Chloroflexota bacterium]MDL1883896.1 protein translocase subunit SecF [Anaerolineae bacterium CFX8]GIL12451.1 MAG: protein-export membrane protein SecF [Chloroflexota bacterium]